MNTKKEMNTLQKLDFVLNKIRYRENIPINYDETAKSVGGWEDYNWVLQQLEEDKYIKREDSKHKITTKGIFFMESEIGYEEKDRISKEEKKRLLSIENQQKAHSRWMIFLTAILAVGTSIAAVYYYKLMP